MNLTDPVLGELWCWAAWLVWLPFFARSVFKAPWQRLRDPARLNVWLGLVVLLTVIWSLKAGVQPGLDLHLLGATVFTLCCGAHLAFVGLSFVELGVTLNGGGDLLAYAANALVLAGWGVLVSQSLTKLFVRVLPKHFFVYIFVNAFFGAALTIFSVGLAATTLLWLAGAYPLSYLASEYLPYFLLLGFSEAWLSGMVMTMFVVYRPEWVSSFDDASYLSDK